MRIGCDAQAVAHGRVRGLRFNWVRDLEARRRCHVAHRHVGQGTSLGLWPGQSGLRALPRPPGGPTGRVPAVALRWDGWSVDGSTRS